MSTTTGVGVSDLTDIENHLARRIAVHERATGEVRSLLTRKKEIIAEVSDLEALVVSVEEAIGVLNSYADSRQVVLQTKIETLVTEGLQTVFGTDLSFHAVSKQQGKLAATDFVIRSTVGADIIETPIMDARGGGVAAVAGFLLRVILLLLRSDARKVLFLDETFAQLSAEYEPRLAEFLRELVDRTHCQIIMVTHSDAYTDLADKVYRFTLKDGITSVAIE